MRTYSIRYEAISTARTAASTLTNVDVAPLTSPAARSSSAARAERVPQTIFRSW